MMIVLVGFMGSGKTSVGRRLAKKLRVPFLDSDRVIEDETGRTIPQIFAESGEAKFRELEADTIARLLPNDGVLALGGGAVSNAETRRLLQDHTVIFLEVSLEEALARVGKDPNRPVLADPLLKQRFTERQEWYREVATHTITIGKKSVGKVLGKALDVLKG